MHCFEVSNLSFFPRKSRRWNAINIGLDFLVFVPLILELLNFLYHSIPFVHLFSSRGYKLVFIGPNLKLSILNLVNPWENFVRNIDGGWGGEKPSFSWILIRTLLPKCMKMTMKKMSLISTTLVPVSRS